MLYNIKGLRKEVINKKNKKKFLKGGENEIQIIVGYGFFSLGAQEIFRTRLQGMAVQRFTSSDFINGFVVEGPDEEGYVYLKASSPSITRAIVRTKWEGTAVQEFLLPSGSYISGFEVSGPDEAGYVYLIAVGSNGDKGAILKTKWEGTAVQAYTASEGKYIKAFEVSGPDEEGYVYLIASTQELDIKEEEEWLEPLLFGIKSVFPNPCIENTKISYSIPECTLVHLKIYDSLGRIIICLVDQEKTPGKYNASWDLKDENGNKVGAGIYFVKLDASSKSCVKKIIITR